MRRDRFKILSKRALDKRGAMWQIKLAANNIDAEPGRFVNILAEGKYLRRPISVSEYGDGVLTLVISIAGEGTRQIVETPVGEELEMLTGLGNRFDLNPETGDRNRVLVLGGGVGYAPLVGLMRKLQLETEMEPIAFFGFNGSDDVPEIHIDELREEGMQVICCTMTGEKGEKGNPIEAAQRYIEREGIEPGYFYTCGPMGMMRAVAKAFPFEGELSLEARMGCGFGACMGCSIKTPSGPKRICREGPVFKTGELQL